MHGLVRCKYERRFSRACGADVSFRDVTIKIPDRRYDQGCEWRHAPEAWAEIFEKSQLVELVEFLPGKKKVDFRLLTEALWRVRTWFGADGKVSIERCYLSPYVEKPLNSKVIKSFVPELRGRKCFSCFGIPMLSIYELWTFYVHFTYSWMTMLFYPPPEKTNLVKQLWANNNSSLLKKKTANDKTTGYFPFIFENIEKNFWNFWKYRKN